MPQPQRLVSFYAGTAGKQTACLVVCGGKKASMGKSKLEKISHGSCSPPTPLFEAVAAAADIRRKRVMSTGMSRSSRMIEN